MMLKTTEQTKSSLCNRCKWKSETRKKIVNKRQHQIRPKRCNFHFYIWPLHFFHAILKRRYILLCLEQPHSHRLCMWNIAAHQNAVCKFIWTSFECEYSIPCIFHQYPKLNGDACVYFYMWCSARCTLNWNDTLLPWYIHIFRIQMKKFLNSLCFRHLE